MHAHRKSSLRRSLLSLVRYRTSKEKKHSPLRKQAALGLRKQWLALQKKTK